MILKKEEVVTWGVEFNESETRMIFKELMEWHKYLRGTHHGDFRRAEKLGGFLNELDYLLGEVAKDD